MDFRTSKSHFGKHQQVKVFEFISIRAVQNRISTIQIVINIANLWRKLKTANPYSKTDYCWEKVRKTAEKWGWKNLSKTFGYIFDFKCRAVDIIFRFKFPKDIFNAPASGLNR